MSLIFFALILLNPTYTEKELGSKFDLRAFHDEVLKNGALPMSVLETHLKEWVAKRRSA